MVSIFSGCVSWNLVVWDTAKHSYKLYVSPHNFNGNIQYLPARGYLRVLTQLIIPETKRLNTSYPFKNGMFLISKTKDYYTHIIYSTVQHLQMSRICAINLTGQLNVAYYILINKLVSSEIEQECARHLI